MKKAELVSLANKMGLDTKKLLRTDLIKLILEHVNLPSRRRSPSPPILRHSVDTKKLKKLVKEAHLGLVLDQLNVPSPVNIFELNDLNKMKKPELITIVENMGFPTKKLLKSELIFLILENQKKSASLPKSVPITSPVRRVSATTSPVRSISQSSRKSTPSPRVSASPVRSISRSTEIDESRLRSLSRKRSKNISTIGDLKNLVESTPLLPLPFPLPFPPLPETDSGPSSILRLSSQTSQGRISSQMEQKESRLRRKESRTKNIKILADNYGFKVIDVPKDGNCMFSAIGRAFNLPQQTIRKLTVNYLQKCKGSFGHIPIETLDAGAIDWDDYVDRLKEDACWGDNVALYAASLALNFQPHVLQADTGEWLKFGENEHNMDRIVYLGYLDQFHYVSLEPKHGKFDILSHEKSTRKCPDLNPIPKTSVPRSQRLRPSIPPSPDRSRLRVRGRYGEMGEESGERGGGERESIPLARLESLKNIKQVIAALRSPLEHKLSTLTNTEKSIMQCIGVA
jgi:hypothetical protein